MKDLTITIVTADRACISECLNRLHYLPGIDQVEVKVFDNSTSEVSRTRVRTLCQSFDFDYKFQPTFIKCRNAALKEVTTPYMMILDDDDYLAVDAIYRILENIRLYPDIDAYYYDVEKESRIEVHNGAKTIINNSLMKYLYLNRFDNYWYDRCHRIYLWNCAVVFRPDILRSNGVEWLVPLCDDIFPMTSLYLLSRSIMKINHPIYYYPVQQLTKKSVEPDYNINLEDNMISSYNALTSIFNGFWDTLIITKSIKNSIRQLESIHGYAPESLKTLLN